MRYPFDPAIVRIRVTPDPATEGPPPVTGGRTKSCRRPHTNSTAAEVRRLIEQTTLTYSEISARTGVGRASICRWTRDGGWQRPPFAPRATDFSPSVRAGQKLKLRQLTERLRALAERAIRELENAPTVDIDKLMQALQVVKMARLEAMGRRRPRRQPDGTPRPVSWWVSRDEAIRAALKEIRRGGVDIDRVPQQALDLFTDAYTPVEDSPMLRPRGKRR